MDNGERWQRAGVRFSELTAEKWNLGHLIEVETSLAEDTIDYSDLSSLLAGVRPVQAGAKAERP